MSSKIPSIESGPSFMYFTIPVQKLPEPTAGGIMSEASNPAVPFFSPFVRITDASARIGFA